VPIVIVRVTGKTGNREKFLEKTKKSFLESCFPPYYEKWGGAKSLLGDRKNSKKEKFFGLPPLRPFLKAVVLWTIGSFAHGVMDEPPFKDIQTRVNKRMDSTMYISVPCVPSSPVSVVKKLPGTQTSLII
ncbi:MAG: hypothetical protein J6S75_05670, partial [Thermoguttaceae bacterium]|nr:hypothetical protein [Thermoguttaceae bacterium]